MSQLKEKSASTGFSEDKALKAAVITLFQQLGLYAQSSRLENDHALTLNSPSSVASFLSKQGIEFSVQQLSVELLNHTTYPCMLVPIEGKPQLVRRHGNKLEKMFVEDTLPSNSSNTQQWQGVDTAEAKSLLTQAGHLFVIEALPSKQMTISHFAKQMSKRTKWYKPVFWLSLLSSLTGLAVPLFTMAVYDRVIGGQTPQALPGIAIGGLLAVVILVFARLARAKVLSTSSNRFARDLSEISFKKLLGLPLMILSRVGSANHIARVRNAEKVRSLLSGPAGAGLIDLPFTLIALATITLLSGWLVIVPLVMLCLFYLVMKLANRYSQSASPTISGEYQNSINELSKNLIQLKTSGDTDGWLNKFARLCRENSRQNFIFAKRNGLNSAIAHAMSLSTALATVFAGIFLVLEQSITSGALIACVMLIWRITGPAQLAFSSAQKITSMDIAVKQFDRFMQAGSEHNELRMDTPELTKAPSLAFEHFTLRYSAETEPALSGVSFEVKPGEIVAVIGPNGCGKTSLLQSAIGVIEGQAGFISLNASNLKQYDPQALRQWAAYSPAQPDLFPGTLAENINVSKLEATEQQMVDALIAAGGESLLKGFNYDLNSKIFNRGHTLLSAVEGSYICLARALLKQSHYLVLDEPIANQNPVARAQFISTLNRLRGNCTVLFSSQDEQLIRQADKVIILDKGSVAYAGHLPDKVPVDEGKSDGVAVDKVAVINQATNKPQGGQSNG